MMPHDVKFYHKPIANYRTLFKMGYARVGKCFVLADGTFHQSFQLGFFLHGGHHLCTSIELKEKIQAHFLKKSNLENVQKLKGLSQFLHFNSIELQALLLMYIIAFSPTLT